MLSLIEVVLKENGVGFVRLDGTLSMTQRSRVLNEFKVEGETRVLLASLRSCGVGLNLTVASRVIMVDPWWNSSVESQAIDRVHRIGQGRDVYVKRLIVRGSVEERMLRIQTRKRELATFIQDEEEGGGGNERMSLEELMELFD